MRGLTVRPRACLSLAAGLIALLQAMVAAGQSLPDRPGGSRPVTLSKPRIAPLPEAKWTDEHTELLVVWCTETITERWKLFKAEDADLPGQKLPLRLLIALRADIRPRLVVRHSLLSVLRGLT